MAVVLNDNDFFTGLSNLALFMRLYATNTSSAPDEFVNSFMTETLGSGDTKIFPWTDLPTVTDYNPVSSLLTVTKVNAGEEYIQITEKKVIKSSYNRYILDMAFTSESGMNNFIGYMLGQMESAKIDHLYNVIVNALYTKDFGQRVIPVQQYDTSGSTSFAEINAGDLINQKNIANTLQLAINNISVYNTQYNGLGNKQALDVRDMKFIFVDPYKTKSVTDLMATLLNSKYISESFDKPELYSIPTSKIPTGSEGTIGFLMHKYAFQMFYKFTFMGSFFDVSNLTINNFLHFWYGMGWLENLPAIKMIARNNLTLNKASK